MSEKTVEEIAAEAAAAEATAAEAAAAEVAAAEEAMFKKLSSDPAVVSRAGIINGMDPADIRARILAAA